MIYYSKHSAHAFDLSSQQKHTKDNGFFMKAVKISVPGMNRFAKDLQM